MTATGRWGALIVAASVLAFLDDARTWAAAWLVAWSFALSVVLGVHVNVWLHCLTGGAWGRPLARLADRMSPTVPWLLAGALPWTVGQRLLYPWAASGSWADALAQPAFAQAWMAPPQPTLRLMLYLVAWWAITRPAMRASRGRAAAALMVYAVLGTLAATDLLASLTPGWHSAAFGLVTLSGQALTGTAWSILRVAADDDATEPPRWHDLGNLLWMWTLLWAYAAYMQFLVIWAEDLPHETVWYRARLDGPWRWASLALVALRFALPACLLLSRRWKSRSDALSRIALLVLAGSVLDSVWTAVPSVNARGGAAVVLALSLSAGACLLLWDAGRPRPAPRRVQP